MIELTQEEIASFIRCQRDAFDAQRALKLLTPTGHAPVAASILSSSAGRQAYRCGKTSHRPLSSSATITTIRYACEQQNAWQSLHLSLLVSLTGKVRIRTFTS